MIFPNIPFEVKVTIAFPNNIESFEQKVDVGVRQMKALDNAIKQASISDSILLNDTWSIMYKIFKNALGESFLEAYEVENTTNS